ncbi:MAG: hemerythrin domain-containing protein [Dehalococcoidales bacterium]|jgi:hemerythrin|nr:hemerythrin domain-containing protein [Dehalococcoidales bacterium]
MSDYLAKVEEIIAEHQGIRDSVRRVGESVSDQEALSSLRSADSDWVAGRPELLEQKQSRLKETLDYLEDGMRKHFAREEEVLPSVLGEFLMRALLLEHQEILKTIDRSRSVALNTKFSGMSREALESRDSEIKQTVDGLCRLVEGHADKEDLMLETVKIALDKGK